MIQLINKNSCFLINNKFFYSWFNAIYFSQKIHYFSLKKMIFTLSFALRSAIKILSIYILKKNLLKEGIEPSTLSS